jgi:hypothetical protein
LGKTIEMLSRMSLENIYKKISHAIFFIISMFFTIAIFLQFSEILYKDILFVGLAVAIELLKNYLIKKLKTKESRKNIFSMIGFILTYLSTAIISGICSYGTIKITLEEQSFYSKNMNKNTEIIHDNLEVIDNVLLSLTESLDASAIEKQKMANKEDPYYSGQNKISEEQSNSLNSVKEFIQMRSELATTLNEENVEVVSSGEDVFTLIGGDFNISGEKTLFYIFISLIFILEGALLATTDGFSHKKDEEIAESEIDKALLYVNNLEKENSVVLNSDDKISNITGISKQECKRYRELLKNTLKWRGKYLINDHNRLNFNMATIKNVIKNYFEGEDTNA